MYVLIFENYLRAVNHIDCYKIIDLIFQLNFKKYQVIWKK